MIKLALFGNFKMAISQVVFFLLLGRIVVGQSCDINEKLPSHINTPCDSSHVLDLLFHHCNSKNFCIHKYIQRGDLAVSGKENIKCWNKSIGKAIKWDIENKTSDSLIFQKLIILGVNQKYVREPAKARLSLKRALKIGHMIYDSTHKDFVKIYRNIAECHYLERDYIKSIHHLDTAYNLLGHSSHDLRKAELFKSYADNYADLGDAYLYNIYSQAYRPYLEKKEPKSLSEYYLNFSRGLSILGNYNQSNEVLDKLESLVKFNPHKMFHDIKAYNHDKLGNTKAAVNEWAKIEKLKPNNHNDLDVLIHRIHKYSYRKDYEKAYSTITKLIQLADSLQNFASLGLAYNHKLILDLKRDQLNDAYESLKKLEQIIFQRKKTNFQSYHSESLHFRYALELLLKLSKQNDPIFLYEAYEIVNKLDSLTRKKIEEFTTDNSNSIKLETKRDLYLQGLEICYELFQKTKDNKYLFKAIELIEQNKAIILINNAKDKVNSTGSQFLAQEKKLKATIELELEKCQSNKTSIDSRLTSANQIHNLAKQVIQLNKKEVSNFKTLMNIDYSSLNSGKAKLVYMTSDSLIFRIFVDSKFQEFDVIPITEEDKKSLHKTITSCASVSTVLDETSIDYLSELLLPIQMIDRSELLILTDGYLSSLPFEILKTNNENLIEHTTISYAYSLQHLEMMKKRISNKIYNFTTFAPSYSDQQVYVSRNNNLGKLLYNIPEVEAIKSHFPQAVNITADEATLDNFMALAPSSNVLHIAAHAKSDTTEAGCHIYFSDESKDYTLSLSDLYKMTIPAELVTLSACETATGEHLTGEGVLSLARGFAYAGAKSVVSSLWSANDQATSMIMSSFYKFLSEGQRKDEALRNSKLEYFQNTDTEYHHPYYWAAFIPVGDMSPLPTRQKPKWPYAIGAILLGAGGVTLGRRRYIS